MRKRLTKSLFVLCLLTLSTFAAADTFTSPAGSGRTYNISVTPGSHTFIITNVVSETYVDWYLGGALRETDHAWALNGYSDPVFNCNLTSGTGLVAAELYNGSHSWVETHRWYYTVGIPDLIVEDIDLTPSQVYPGNSTMQRTVRIRNIGDVSSISCKVRLSTYVNSSFISTDIITCPPLSPGQSSTFVDQPLISFPSTGSYSVRITADADYYDDVEESNENNNHREETFIIDVVPEPLPDLVLTSISLSKTDFLPGESLGVNMTVQNQGVSSSAACTLQYNVYIDNQSVLAPINIPCPALSPGQSYVISDNLSITSFLSGNHILRIYAIIDYYDDVTESNENNNTRDESFPITLHTIKMLSPNGGEELSVDGSFLVEWETSGSISTVNLDFSIDNGQTWESLATDITNTGQYNWVITDYWISQTCLMQISDTANASVYDESDNTFQVFVCTLNYDLDGNCFIDLNDLALLSSEWFQSGNPYN